VRAFESAWTAILVGGLLTRRGKTAGWEGPALQLLPLYAESCGDGILTRLGKTAGWKPALQLLLRYLGEVLWGRGRIPNPSWNGWLGNPPYSYYLAAYTDRRSLPDDAPCRPEPAVALLCPSFALSAVVADSASTATAEWVGPTFG